jgi:integrase/recombinase XerC
MAGVLNAAPARPATAREALTDWLAYLTHERRASTRTVRAYGDAVTAYLNFLERHNGEAPSLARMAQISAGDLRAYLAHRRAGDHPLAPRSVSQALSAIRAFHRWLDRRLDIVNPAIGLVRGPRLKPGLPRPVSEDQAHGLIVEAGLSDRADWEIARDEALITLLWGCGLRISEALSLRGRDLPLGEAVRITGKGGKTRLVPVLPVVREAVDAYVAALPVALGADDPVFRAIRGGAFSPRHAQALMGV